MGDTNQRDDRPAALIVLGASAGGVDALATVVGGLPSDLRAAVLVVLHISPLGKSVLPEILTRAGDLPAHHAADGDRLEAGRVYVAPPDHHLVVQDGRVRITRGAKENGLRPAADVLFRSAANSGAKVIGVVLSGTLDDGTQGLREVTRRGGVAVVQDPAEAAFPSMPLHAMQFAGADHVVSLEKIPKLLVDLVAELAAQDETLPSGKADPMADDEDPHPDGEPSYFTCPDCGGTLWEHDEHGLLRFRCRVGHAYSTEGLLGGQLGALESALWAAVVALEERRDLAAKLGRRLEQRGSRSSSRRFLRESEDANRRAGVVREALLGLSTGLPDEPEEEALGEAN